MKIWKIIKKIFHYIWVAILWCIHQICVGCSVISDLLGDIDINIDDF